MGEGEGEKAKETTRLLLEKTSAGRVINEKTEDRYQAWLQERGRRTGPDCRLGKDKVPRSRFRGKRGRGKTPGERRVGKMSERGGTHTVEVWEREQVPVSREQSESDRRHLEVQVWARERVVTMPNVASQPRRGKRETVYWGKKASPGTEQSHTCNCSNLADPRSGPKTAGQAEGRKKKGPGLRGIRLIRMYRGLA